MRLRLRFLIGRTSSLELLSAKPLESTNTLLESFQCSRTYKLVLVMSLGAGVFAAVMGGWCHEASPRSAAASNPFNVFKELLNIKLRG